MKSRFVVVMALAAMLLCSSVSFGDVMNTIKTDGIPDVMVFDFSTYWHQTRFLTGRNDGNPPIDPSLDGYITVEGPTMETPVMGYGVGSITVINTQYGNGAKLPISIGTEITTAFGNLPIIREELVVGAYSTDVGPGMGFDVLTGEYVAINAVEYGTVPLPGYPGTHYVVFETHYDFGVEGDYNRDGVVNWDSLASAPAPGDDPSDRPFIAIYENDGTGDQYVNTNKPDFDADGDGIRTDNAWVGNPYVSVDAVDPGPPAPAAAGLDADPSIQNVNGFDTPLLVGEIVGMTLGNTVYLTEPQGPGRLSQSNIQTSGFIDVMIVGGRLLEELRKQPGYADVEYLRAVIDASAKFDPFDSNDYPNQYEWGGTGSLEIFFPEPTDIPIAEPGSLSLLLGGVALAFRRRRK